ADDGEEAMTMADRIAVMSGGRIEQLGAPDELYERPTTPFVAGFLGISNMLPGTVVGPDSVRLADGTVVRAQVNGKSGAVAAGVRPEKITIGDGGGANVLQGTIAESAYLGVATQLVVRTAAGQVQAFAQDIASGARVAAPGYDVTLRWCPESTFVMEQAKEGEE